ncbi:MAG: hypothetical protein IJW53_00230 [Clostridia bacterium]|nr:hypothetical protein [Clostridia bacterium]
MFLTKKGLRKIILVALCYFVLGSFCIVRGISNIDVSSYSKFLIVLGVICYVLCPFITFTGYFSEGTGKVINLGNKLVRHELKPAEFIKEYHQLTNASDLIVNKPNIYVLQLVAMAYDCLDEREKALSSADEMIATANEKKRTYAKLIKSSLLFAYGMKEDAEALFTEACASKQDFTSRTITEMIIRTDRAFAMEDYKTVELYNLDLLTHSLAKQNKLSLLTIHFKLGEVYEKTNNNEKAIPHYQYCVENGGETALKNSAKVALERIQ